MSNISFIKKLTACLLAGLVIGAAVFRQAFTYFRNLVPMRALALIAPVTLVASIICLIVWQAQPRRRNNPAILAFWQGLIRYGVAFDLAEFGWVKICHRQLAGPLRNLDLPYSSFSPNELFWTFFSHSYLFACIIGALELGGAILLLFRRTRLAGVFVLLPLLANILLMDIFYQIGFSVVVHASIMTAGVLYFLFFEYDRLREFFFQSTDNTPVLPLSPVAKWAIRLSIIYIPLLLIGFRGHPAGKPRTAPAAQAYAFPHISVPAARQIATAIDTVFAGIRMGRVPPDWIGNKDKDLTREILEYYKDRLTEAALPEIINCYPLDSQQYRVTTAFSKTGLLRQIFTFDVFAAPTHAVVDLPLWHDTRNWASARAGTILYHYDHDFDLKAAQDFDKANRRIAAQLNLPVDSFDFYLSDNYQQIMQWLGLTYDTSMAGRYRDGFNVERTIFAIGHSEDFSHDLVHYYVYKVRKGPRNPYAEEGVAYYWGNAYYPDGQGRMIPLSRLTSDLRAYAAGHPNTDWLTLFRNNQRGLFGPAKEVSVRATLSGLIVESIEKKHGTPGVLQLINCGPGEANFFRVTHLLAGIDTTNFSQRIAELAGD